MSTKGTRREMSSLLWNNARVILPKSQFHLIERMLAWAQPDANRHEFQQIRSLKYRI